MAMVPTVRTVATNLEFIQELIEAWRELYNETPSKQSVGIIFAQHGIETGGGMNCWCWNISNVKWSPTVGDTVDHCALTGVWEIINGKRIEIPPTDPGAWFLAFPTLLAGCKFHLDLLKNKRYKSSWIAIQQGSVVNFATLLRDHGYYTAPLKDYIDGMNRFYQPYMKTTTYEQAISILDTTAPPLQPWVEVPVLEPMLGVLQVNPEMSEKSPVEQGIEDAGKVSQSEIEEKGSGIASKLLSYLQTLLQWLPKRK